LFDASSWNKDTNRLGINANSTRHGLLPTTCILGAPAVLLGQSWAPVQYQLPGYQPGWYLCCILHHFDAFRHWIHDLLCPSKFSLPRCPVMPVSKSSVSTSYDVECCKLQKLCPYNSLDGVPARPRCLLVSFPDHFLNLSAYPGPVWYQIGFVGGRHSAPQHLTHEGVHVARGAFAWKSHQESCEAAAAL